MRTIAIINQKGGCGKTTSAINLSAVLARNNKRVLLVDMDPQGHCAAGLGIPEQRIELDIGDAMLAIGSRPLDPARLLWRAVRNLDLAPSRMKLAGLEAARGGLAELPDKSRRLAQVLEKFRQEYDIAVIDCSPSIGLLTFNALAAADMVLIPVETGFFSLQGATRQVHTVQSLSKRLGILIPVWLVPTMHDASNSVAQDLLDELHRQFKDRVAPVTIRRDPRLREAASFGQTILDYAPGSNGAEDYGRLGVWAIENLHGRQTMPVDTNVAHDSMAGTAIADGNASLNASNGAAATRNGAMHGQVETGANSPNEIKSISRAEDVARRAQEFLRRIAMGRGMQDPSRPGRPATHASDAAQGQSVTNQRFNTPPPIPHQPVGQVPSQTVDEVQRQAVATQTLTLHPPRNVLTIESATLPDVPLAPGAASLLGVRETNQGVLFVQPINVGRVVSVAGSFNGWSPTAHIFKANTELGVHELCLRLPAGKHEYRLVIDGRWTHDVHNESREVNPYGGYNSILVVGQRVSSLVSA